MSTNIGTSMYSDPSMRPYLQQLYDRKYADIRVRLGENSDEEKIIQFRTALDDKIHEGRVLSLAKCIPSFDKWLEMNQLQSVFDRTERDKIAFEDAEKMLDEAEHNGPDTPSDARIVFSDGSKILGYINKDGLLATEAGGHALINLRQQASDLNLSGASEISYMRVQGEKLLSRQYPNLKVTDYRSTAIPTKREFMKAWYPHEDVDATYRLVLESAKDHLADMKGWYQQDSKHINDIITYLHQVMDKKNVARELA